jgi:expansin (peptidoglycan-binding protein)
VDGKACPAPTWQFATASILSNVGRGACGYDPAALPVLVASIDDKGFDEARGCGICLRLVPGRTDVITKYVDVLVVDRAGDNASSPRQLNISRQAMDAIALSGTENMALNFALVPCPTTLVSPTIHMSTQQGSSSQHLSVQIRDQALPLSSAEIRFAGTWSAMTFATYNYWIFDSLGVAPPYTFRLTNVLGDTITVDDITLTSTATADGPATDTGDQFPSCTP